ncbi:MAG: citrate lyase subunit beta [Propionibacteriaceae bacterium]|jgi:citrate lyase subunit beta/citryl-CoA lyase|nr:citrate lyase subunit beta [Propionibacteriaceae bacterium]
MSKYAAVAEIPARSMMFVPASNASMLSTAAVYGADAFVFDLEDAVSPREKDSARLLAFHALQSPLWRGLDVIIRVNGVDTPQFEADIDAMVRGGAAAIRLPMVSDAAMVRHLDDRLTEREQAYGRPPGSVKIVAAVESAAGVANAIAIATASPRLSAIALAAFDYLVDMRAVRSPGGAELFYARCAVLHAARVAKIAAYDVVYGRVDDEAGFIAEAELAKGLGFDGKSLINPRQIPLLHRVYTPSEAETAKAEHIVAAAEAALAAGVGAINVDGAMIDNPVVDAARRVIAYAAAGRNR